MRQGGVWGVLAAVVFMGCGGALEHEAGLEELESREQEHEQEPPGDTAWTRFPAGPGDDFGQQVEHDRDGNVIVVQRFNDRLEDQDGVLTVPGPRGMAVSKYRPDGVRLWVRTFWVIPGSFPSGEEPMLLPLSLAVARDRSIFVAGLLRGAVDFGGGAVGEGGFLVQLDARGRHIQSRDFEATGRIVVDGLTVSRAGDIFMAGYFEGTLMIDGRRFESPGLAIPTAFVARLSPRARLQWLSAGPDGSRGTGLAMDSAGDLYFSGVVETTLTPFLFKFSPSGRTLWRRFLAGSSGTHQDVAVHGNRVVVAGQFCSDFTFRGRRLSSGGHCNGLLAAYTREGEERWARDLGDFTLISVSMGEDDGTVVGGFYLDGDDLGLGPVAGVPGRTNGFAARYNRIDGAAEWVRPFPGASNPQDVAAGRRGASSVVGFYLGEADFGDGPRFSSSGTDSFILHFPP